MRALGGVVALGAGLAVLASVTWAGERASRDPSPKVGTVTGRVSFAGTAPANPQLDMSSDPWCVQHTTTPHAAVVVVNPNGTLANVFVYVKTGLPPNSVFEPSTSEVVVEEKGCQYEPRVFGIMVGQKLRIVNGDSTQHKPEARGLRNIPFTYTQPYGGMALIKKFMAPEVMLLFACNLHPWMRAYVGVQAHPFFATTGPDGTFRITGLVPGTYTLEAWHELYGTQTVTVTVQGGDTKTADFAFAAH